MATKWEHEELQDAHRKGYERGWGVKTYDVRDGWVFVGFDLDNGRIYAPSEHPELPNQFAKVSSDTRTLQRFLETYGHLGYANLPASKGRRQRPPDDSIEALGGEPVSWINAHAQSGGVFRQQPLSGPGRPAALSACWKGFPTHTAWDARPIARTPHGNSKTRCDKAHVIGDTRGSSSSGLLRNRCHGGASVIKCCYAATGMYMMVAAAVLRKSANASTPLSHKTTRRTDTKMSRRVSRRVASPACIAGVRVSRPNLSARCGRTKL